MRIWVASLLAVIALGAIFFTQQLNEGMLLTGMTRDVSWGLYISQFIFAAGIAAAVLILLVPTQVHRLQPFASLVVPGQIIAISAVLVSVLFIVADLGQPSRLLNVILHPSPRSLMFWDMLALTGFAALNAISAAAALRAERNELAPPSWTRILLILSIVWAVGIRVVSAFLLGGLPARPLWLTALLAPRLLASSFASGSALLILIWRAEKLTPILVYSLLLNLLFTALEVFTAAYSGIPEHVEAMRHLYINLAPWTWTSIALAIAALAMIRRHLVLASAAALASMWIDKGFLLVVAGFAPAAYTPTFPEIAITCGIWATGLLLATFLLRITNLIGETR